VNSWSLTIPIENVRLVPRSDDNVSVMGTSAGPAPSVPAIVVARSWSTVPMTSPVLAIFIELMRLGRMACT
jgi:hypothetical protein